MEPRKRRPTTKSTPKQSRRRRARGQLSIGELRARLASIASGPDPCPWWGPCYPPEDFFWKLLPALADRTNLEFTRSPCLICVETLCKTIDALESPGAFERRAIRAVRLLERARTTADERVVRYQGALQLLDLKGITDDDARVFRETTRVVDIGIRGLAGPAPNRNRYDGLQGFARLVALRSSLEYMVPACQQCRDRIGLLVRAGSEGEAQIADAARDLLRSVVDELRAAALQDD